MTRCCRRASLQVVARPFACPGHNMVVLHPVLQDGRVLCLERSTVYPAFGRGASHGIADDAHGTLQAVGENAAEVVADGREAGGSRRRTGLPTRRTEVKQAVNGVHAQAVPHFGVGNAERGHLVQVQAAQSVGRAHILGCRARLAKWQFHIRLT